LLYIKIKIYFLKYFQLSRYLLLLFSKYFFFDNLIIFIISIKIFDFSKNFYFFVFINSGIIPENIIELKKSVFLFLNIKQFFKFINFEIFYFFLFFNFDLFIIYKQIIQ